MEKQFVSTKFSKLFFFTQIMRLRLTFTGNRRLLLRAVLGRRHFCVTPERYYRRNYAQNVTEYNSVVRVLTAYGRNYLLRDVYDDLVLDGIQPSRDLFHSLIVGSMKGARMQDALYFRDEMKAMGLVPDVALYNILISTCGKCNIPDKAIQILEEMKRYEVQPNGQTSIILLNACAAAGRIDLVYAIVRDMTAAGLGLNKFCYAGLITAHKNKIPPADDTPTKIIELVEESKGLSSVEASSENVENVMTGVTEEELYNVPTAEYVHRRGFVNRQLTVYHVALQACADLRSVEATDALLEMLKNDGFTPDVFITMQIMRCYLHAGDLDRGAKVIEDHIKSRIAPLELYVTLVEGAMVGYTPKGMHLALDTLAEIASMNFFLGPKMANDLLTIAAGEKTGGYGTANFIWDLMQSQGTYPSLCAVEAYYNGLRRRAIPPNDPRLVQVARTYASLQRKVGPTCRTACS